MLQYSSDSVHTPFSFILWYMPSFMNFDRQPCVQVMVEVSTAHALIKQLCCLTKWGRLLWVIVTSLLLTYNEYFPDGQLGSSQRSQALTLEPAPTYYLSVLSAPVIAQLGCRQRLSLCLIAKSDLWVHLVCRAQVGWVLVLDLGRAPLPWALR